MRDFIKCKICGDCHWTDKKCKPIYYVSMREEDGTYNAGGDTIRANSHSEAAEKYAKEYNECNGYCMMNLDDGEVFKVEDLDGNIQYFNILAEPDIYYDVTEIEKEVK